MILFKEAPKIWKDVLEKICNLIDDNNGDIKKVISKEDRGRIKFFIEFWKKINFSKSNWLKEILDRLEKAMQGMEDDVHQPWLG